MQGEEADVGAGVDDEGRRREVGCGVAIVEENFFKDVLGFVLAGGVAGEGGGDLEEGGHFGGYLGSETREKGWCGEGLVWWEVGVVRERIETVEERGGEWMLLTFGVQWRGLHVSRLG